MNDFFKENKLATTVASVSLGVIVVSSLFLLFFNDAPSKMEYGSYIMKSEYKDMTTDDGRDGEYATNLFDDLEVKEKVDTTAENSEDSTVVVDGESPSAEVAPEASTTEGENHSSEANPTTTEENN